MGCSEDTYEEAVRRDILRFINDLSISNEQKRLFREYVTSDLSKKALALENYQYIYRDEDKIETVEDYKKYICKYL